jgi:hypothetical protein
MRRQPIRDFVLAVAVGSACSTGASVQALEILADTTTLTGGERSVLDVAIDRWERAVLDPFVLALAVSRIDSDGQIVARTSDFTASQDGRPASACLELGDPEDVPVFVDPTPWLDDEFLDEDGDGFVTAVPGSPADGQVDLLTVLNHELAHALGFTVFYDAFAARVTQLSDGGRLFTGNRVQVMLTSDGSGTHLDPVRHPRDLLNPVLDPGVRIHISATDLQVLVDAFGYSVTEGPPASVPEPPTMLLLSLAGLLSLLSATLRRCSDTTDPVRLGPRGHGAGT